MKNIIKSFIHSKSEGALLARTVFEAGMGFISMHIVQIVGRFNLSSETSALIVAFVTVMTTALLNWYRKCTAEEGVE